MSLIRVKTNYICKWVNTFYIKQNEFRTRAILTHLNQKNYYTQGGVVIALDAVGVVFKSKRSTTNVQ